MQRLSSRMNDVRERLESARERGDDDAVERLQTEQQELLTQQLSMFKYMLRPMAWTVWYVGTSMLSGLTINKTFERVGIGA